MTNMQYLATNLVESATVSDGGLLHIDSDTNSGAAAGICATGGYVFCADGANGLDSYSYSSSALTFVDNDTDVGAAAGCCAITGYIFVADGANGVDSYSHAAGVLTHVDNDGASSAATGCCMTAGDTYLVVSDGANGIDSYSLIAGAMTHVDNENTSTAANGCALTLDGYIIVADGANGIDSYSHAVGVFTHVDNDPNATAAVGVCVTTDGYIFVADGANGLRSFSHSAGTLTYIDVDDQGGNAYGVCAYGNYIIVANGTRGVDVYSHSAGTLTHLFNDDQGGTAKGCAVTSDSYIAIANDASGVELYTLQIVASTDTYQLANLYNQRPGKPLVVATTPTFSVIIDMAAATALTFVALIGHNIDSGATVKLEGNATDTWESPSESQTISYVATNEYKIFASASYRYWRLSVTGAASADIKIGELVLGVIATLTNNYQWGSEKERTYKNIAQNTEYGQPWRYYLYNQRAYALTFAVDDTTVTEIETLQTAVLGGNTPFCFINWDSEVVYVMMNDEIAWSRVFTNYNESKIDLVEVPLGKDI